MGWILRVYFSERGGVFWCFDILMVVVLILLFFVEWS